jgi:hypothetical protein
MKKLAIALLFAGFTFTSFSQEHKVLDKSENYPIAGTQDGFYVVVHHVTLDNIEKAIKNQLKKWKGKYSDRDGIFIDDAKLKSIGENTFDVYGKIIEEAGEVVSLAFAIDLGGAYVNKEAHPAEYREFKKLIHEIAVACSKEAVEEEIEVQEDVLKDKNKDQEKLESEKEKLEKSIKDFEQKIVEAKAEIVTNEDNQAKKKIEITDEETKLKEIQTKLNSIK